MDSMADRVGELNDRVGDVTMMSLVGCDLP